MGQLPKTVPFFCDFPPNFTHFLYISQKLFSGNFLPFPIFLHFPSIPPPFPPHFPPFPPFFHFGPCGRATISGAADAAACHRWAHAPQPPPPNVRGRVASLGGDPVGPCWGAASIPGLRLVACRWPEMEAAPSARAALSLVVMELVPQSALQSCPPSVCSVLRSLRRCFDFASVSLTERPLRPRCSRGCGRGPPVRDTRVLLMLSMRFCLRVQASR